ncbi:MAG: PorP/SprF family type IX secretion system membrane protein [Cyclobacteriaceae bacterium]
MNCRIRSGLILIASILTFSAVGQNDFFFNHYMFNPSYYNPAWVGVESEAFVAGHHRSQWLGYESSFDGSGGAPSSQMVSLVIPARGKLAGVGLSLSNDRVANLTNLQARFSVSGRKEFRFGSIFVGLMPTIFSQSLDFSQFRPVEQEDRFAQGKESQIKFDLNAGLYFESNRNYFIGFSAVNILEPTFDYGTQSSVGDGIANSISTNYLINAGTSFGISRDLTFRPTTLIRTDFKSYTFELSGIAYYQEKMWGGLSFRRSESISLLMGYAFLNNQLRFGYAFDYVIKDREAKQPTSHEIYIRYNLPNLVFGGRKAVKTPRFNF